jgi:hypothetical protein
MSRLVLSLVLGLAACASAPTVSVATGVPEDLVLYECWMRKREVLCATPEFHTATSDMAASTVGGPGQTCVLSYHVYPNGGCHDPTALQHCLRGVERRERTCDDPMPAACAYVYRPCGPSTIVR